VPKKRDDVGHRGLVRVELGDVGRDPALELEHLLAIGALVENDDLEAAVEVRELLELLEPVNQASTPGR
jgi:hypothetical protein